jgi:hypothetical protein
VKDPGMVFWSRSGHALQALHKYTSMSPGFLATNLIIRGHFEGSAVHVRASESKMLYAATVTYWSS